jgi:hypothetical protein
MKSYAAGNDSESETLVGKMQGANMRPAALTGENARFL